MRQRTSTAGMAGSAGNLAESTDRTTLAEPRPGHPAPPPRAGDAPRRVDVVVYPGFKAIEAIGTLSVFRYTNLHLAALGRPPAYDVQVVASQTGPVVSDTLMSLDATRSLNEPVAPPDIAVLVGARHIEQALADHPELVDWTRAMAGRTPRLVALCTATFFMAAAGLLDGQRVATHWSVAERLQQRFPRIAVDADALYVEHEGLWTSAGVTACIDLMLALVEQDLGREIAHHVARDLVVYMKRPGGQSQFSLHLASQATTHPGIRRVQDWILSNLAQRFTVPELAARASMSERNFRRVFQKVVGSTPAAFIDQARLDAARRLLEAGDLPLKVVAGRVGYTSEQPLRRLFVKHLQTAPADWRAAQAGLVTD